MSCWEFPLPAPDVVDEEDGDPVPDEGEESLSVVGPCVEVERWLVEEDSGTLVAGVEEGFRRGGSHEPSPT